MQKVQVLELTAVTIYLMDLSDFEYVKYLDALNTEEKQHVSALKNEQKKKEYTAIRWMKTTLFGNITINYAEDGSPTLNSSTNISITHTKKYACFAVSETRKIGVDIEYINPRAVKVQHKYCNEQEATLFDTTNEFDMTLLWSLKESLYKLSNRQQLLFKTDICIEKRSPEIAANVRFESGFKRVTLAYQIIDNHILTFTTSTPL